MIVKNTFFGTFFRLGGGLKVVKIKKKSISNSATKKLSRGVIKKNPWCDPLKKCFQIFTVTELKGMKMYSTKKFSRCLKTMFYILSKSRKSQMVYIVSDVI